MKKSVPTVTVAASAFNEENNIIGFLKSVLEQKEDGFKLEKILVISDGSHDKTVVAGRSLDSKKIVVKAYRKREGKSSRLNDIYSELVSDILFQTDADVILSEPYVIAKLIKPIIKDKNVGMCSGNALPVKPTTLMEKAISTTREAYYPIKKTLRGGHNKLSVNGRILAYKKEFIKKIKIPSEVIGNDAFTYFSCLSMGYSYRYVDSAVVYFRSPMTLKDHIKQNTRFIAVPARLENYFPKELIKKEYNIPLLTLAYYLSKQFFKHPFLSTYIFFVNKYCSLRARFLHKNMDGKWEIASSTKIIN